MSRERTRRLVLAIVAIAITAAVLGFLAFGGIGENLVYYWSPTELQGAGDDAVGATIRLGGLVEPGTIERSEDGLTTKFAVTDGGTSVSIGNGLPFILLRGGNTTISSTTLGTRILPVSSGPHGRSCSEFEGPEPSIGDPGPRSRRGPARSVISH